MSLCPTCSQESLRWLDYQPVRPLRINHHAHYDDTPAGAADNRRARFEDWARTIRTQQALIAQHCATTHQQPTTEEAAAA